MCGVAMSYIVPWFPDSDFSAITDCIYISNIASACNLAELKRLGITHVISVLPGFNPIYPEDIVYMNIHIRDTDDAPISDYFKASYDFIDEAVERGGKVLVHCLRGVSRSTTLVCYYLMRKHGISATQALEFVAHYRPIAKPNPGFMRALKLQERVKHEK